ncbi:MAG TPA: alpha/beta hydrolase [Gemmatimonadaceae bacterium]|nr:alpha/beta hydrolase [Gemmatimonadaceae bacterium]
MSYADFVAFRRALPRTPRLERQTVRARGIAFAVFSSPPVAGAPPLLCINGGMIYDHSMLWPALSPLAATRQVILFDLRGRGASSAPADPLAATVEDDAADVGAIRRALGVRRWDVLGHSWGGGIAMLASALDQAAVRRLVLIDAVGPTSDWMAALRENVLGRLTGAERDAVAAIPESALADPDPELHSRYSRAVYPAWFADPEMASHFTPPDARSATGAAVLARLRGEGYDWRERLRALSVPTLVIHGEADALPLAVSVDNTYILANARRAVVPSSGHMPFWEAPERCFALIESFL